MGSKSGNLTIKQFPSLAYPLQNEDQFPYFCFRQEPGSKSRDHVNQNEASQSVWSSPGPKILPCHGCAYHGTRYPEQLGEIHLVDELMLSEREQGREGGDSVDASLFLQLKYSLNGHLRVDEISKQDTYFLPLIFFWGGDGLKGCLKFREKKKKESFILSAYTRPLGTPTSGQPSPPSSRRLRAGVF
jgi:hypothetical protein